MIIKVYSISSSVFWCCFYFVVVGYRSEKRFCSFFSLSSIFLWMFYVNTQHHSFCQSTFETDMTDAMIHTGIGVPVKNYL